MSFLRICGRIGAVFILCGLSPVFPAQARYTAEEPLAVHVVVALCDNENQGIVPVPVKIGNGKDAGNNLYWGAAYGMRTFFRKRQDWKEVPGISGPGGSILERRCFVHTSGRAVVTADAWDGAAIQGATEAFFNYAAGKDGAANRIGLPAHIGTGSTELRTGGAADLIIYIGHNGLMDFQAPPVPPAADSRKRLAAVFACKSGPYFFDLLQKAGAEPLVLTYDFMCPEAYTTHALIEGLLAGEDAARLRLRVAAAYAEYQKCGIKGANRMFGAKQSVKQH